MVTRTFHLILIVSSDPDRLNARHGAIRHAGYHALPTRTVSHAVILAHKARPSVVLTDSALDDGRALSLVRALRTHEALRQVPVILLGVLLPDEEDLVAHDPHTHVHAAAEEATLMTVVENLLVASRAASLSDLSGYASSPTIPRVSSLAFSAPRVVSAAPRSPPSSMASSSPASSSVAAAPVVLGGSVAASVMVDRLHSLIPSYTCIVHQRCLGRYPGLSPFNAEWATRGTHDRHARDSRAVALQSTASIVDTESKTIAGVWAVRWP